MELDGYIFLVRWISLTFHCVRIYWLTRFLPVFGHTSRNKKNKVKRWLSQKKMEGDSSTQSSIMHTVFLWQFFISCGASTKGKNIELIRNALSCYWKKHWQSSQLGMYNLEEKYASIQKNNIWLASGSLFLFVLVRWKTWRWAILIPVSVSVPLPHGSQGKKLKMVDDGAQEFDSIYGATKPHTHALWKHHKNIPLPSAPHPDQM